MNPARPDRHIAPPTFCGMLVSALRMEARSSFILGALLAAGLWGSIQASSWLRLKHAVIAVDAAGFNTSDGLSIDPVLMVEPRRPRSSLAAIARPLDVLLEAGRAGGRPPHVVLSGLDRLQVGRELRGIQSLTLWRCEDLSSLEGLSDFPELRSLEISDCPKLAALRSLPALSSLTALQVLGAGVTTLENMPALPSLTALAIGHCPELSTLAGMPAFTGLTSFSIGNCDGLTTISGLPELPALTMVGLEQCDNLAGIGELSRLPKLTTVALIECPKLARESDPVIRLRKQRPDLIFAFSLEEWKAIRAAKS